MHLKFSLGTIPETAYRRNPRYNCLSCRDSGWVYIWTPETIQAAVTNPDNVEWTTCVCRCSCDAAGPDTKNAGQRKGKALPVFGSERWHIDANAPDAKATSCAYVHKPAGYNNEFAEYDERIVNG